MIGKTNAISGVSEPVPKIRTVSGSVISISNALALPAVSLAVAIDPVQDLHGYANPWVGGTGKNKFDPSEAQNNKWVNSSTGAIENANGYWVTGYIPVTAGDVVRCPTKGSARNAWYNTDKSQATYVAYSGAGNGITAPADGFIVLTVKESDFPFGSDSNFVVTRNDADLTYAPYENLCPISGWSNVNVYREAQYDAGATPYATINLNGTRYGCTLDVTSGVLTVIHGYLQKNTTDMNNNEDYPGWKSSGVRAMIGEGINGRITGAILNVGTIFNANTRSSNDTLFLPIGTYNLTQTEWQALALDCQFVIPLATPQTVQLTPTQVQMLLGNNVIWADSGDTELQYWARR